MIAAAVFFLPALAMSAPEYMMAGVGKGCKETCEAKGLECDKDARLALDSKAKVVDLYKGLKCTFYSPDARGPFRLGPDGHGRWYCLYASQTPNSDIDCASPAHGIGSNLCACSPPAPSCVNPEEDHELEANEDGIIVELNQCHFNEASSCSCMNTCQQDEGHLSFEWKEGEAPNCCCYVNV